MRFINGAACTALLAAALFTTSCAQAPGGSAGSPAEPKPTTPTQLLNACELNLKQIGTSLQMYAGDAKGAYPTALSALVPKYLTALPTCPVANKDTYSTGYATVGAVYTVVCAGEYHTSAQVGPNFPQYTTPRSVDAPASGAPAAASGAPAPAPGAPAPAPSGQASGRPAPAGQASGVPAPSSSASGAPAQK